ncbi:VUT family protein, partial [Phaeovulum sp.]|uniref:VUT family protein n=1 Tax=Phaeovulum sp. TaxID=2934796 RepID=UPI00356872A5
GPAAARRVVLAGFGVGIACSLVAAGFNATTERIAIGSGLAFLTAQMTDVAVFDRLRGGRWWRAPLISTLVGASLDTIIFFSVAFSDLLSFVHPGEDTSWATGAVPMLGMGPQAPLWVSLALADLGVKLSLALVALPLFRIIVKKMTTRYA